MEMIKPCPFCNGKAIEDTYYVTDFLEDCRMFHHVYCIRCGAKTDDYSSSDEAIKAWNRRVSGAENV